MRNARGTAAIWLALLVAAYLGLSLGFASSVPLFEGPDEPGHLEYLGFIAMNGRLPGESALPDVPGEGMQAPLYYVLGAPFFAGAAGSASTSLLRELHRANLSIYGYDRTAIRENRRHIRAKPGGPVAGDARHFVAGAELTPLLRLRLLSLGFGLIAVLLTYVSVRRACDDSNLALLASGILAFNPQFLFVSAVVNNDAAATAAGAATFWIAAEALRDPAAGRRLHLLFAPLVCLALLAKNSTLPGIAIAGLTIFLTDRRPVRARVADAALSGGLALLLLAPFLIWSTLHRGGPLGMEAYWSMTRHMTDHSVFGGLWPFYTGAYWTWTFTSYWAQFGWLSIDAPPFLYGLFAALSLAGLIGFVAGSWEELPGSRALALRRYLVATIVANLAAHIWVNLAIPQPQGRHLFPSAPQISCALALGITRLASRNGRLGEWSNAAMLVGLFLVGLYCLLGVIGPAYGE